MKIFLKLFTFLYSRRVDRVEKKIGYKIMFNNIPEIWINGWMRFDMEKSLAKHGIHAWCVDYFTMGSLTRDDVSSRFVRSEKQYQSWLGAYLVKFKDNREFTIQEHFNLAVADQKNWLEDFGDPSPYCEISAENFVESGVIQIGEYSGTLYEDRGSPSHSDVGSNSNNKDNRMIMSLMASMFNTCNPTLNLKGNNFIPKNISTEYETVILKGYIAIMYITKDTSVVLYGNGAAFLDMHGREVKDYTPFLKENIRIAFKAMDIIKK